jgi:H+-transporting ATPase
MKQRTDDYARHTAWDTLKALDANVERGFSEDEVAQRLAQYGYNEIREKEEPLWHRVFRRFWGPIPWMIETAAVLSALVQKWDDFIIIAVLLPVNAGLDFFQEHRALNALKALKQRMTAEIIVLRDGEFKTIPSRELVPRDIVKLRIGNIVPADVQLFKGDYLLIDRSALTGESLPVSKKANEAAYASTFVTQGEMLAVVVNTGADTNFHTVVALVAKASLEERSHFQKMVIKIGDFLIMITVVMVVLIFMVAMFRHEHFLEIARFALVLTVASIPVALPAVLSVTMAVGAMNLARRQAIVSRLTAIEELAGVDVFCSDKTGTLTKNEMHVVEPVMLGTHTEQELFLVAENVIRSMLFLKLIVAGHSTLYITRTEGLFWQRPWPAPLLFGATFGTEIIGTLIAVYGFLITPVGRKYALWMWAYALLWFVFNNVVKIGAYRLMRRREVIA